MARHQARDTSSSLLYSGTDLLASNSLQFPPGFQFDHSSSTTSALSPPLSRPQAFSDPVPYLNHQLQSLPDSREVTGMNRLAGPFSAQRSYPSLGISIPKHEQEGGFDGSPRVNLFADTPGGFLARGALSILDSPTNPSR